MWAFPAKAKEEGNFSVTEFWLLFVHWNFNLTASLIRICDLKHKHQKEDYQLNTTIEPFFDSGRHPIEAIFLKFICFGICTNQTMQILMTQAAHAIQIM